MKGKPVWLGALALIVAIGGISLIALPRGPEWTTSSEEALAEFEAGLDAEMKIYAADAVRHFDRALELDPEFAMAKLRVVKYIGYYNKKRAKQIWEDLAAVDVDKLKPRERAMIDHALARHDERYEDAEQILNEYVAAHPDDYYMLEMKALNLFSHGESEEAELLYRRLLELEPNFVLAYNQLGYITMLQTRFAEAEEYFTSYRFIAPDQANPHDSLGELYIIEGRYDEAEASFNAAIEIKPEFWHSYHGLAYVRMLEADFEGAAEAIDRFAALDDAPEWEVERLRCRLKFAEAEADQAWDVILAEDLGSCFEKGRTDQHVIVVGHRAACLKGDWERAKAIETMVQEYLDEEMAMGVPEAKQGARPVLLHLQGVRHAVEGDFETAEKLLREADARIMFREAAVGLFKLRNQTMLVETLFAQGDDAEAHQLLAKVRSVNPLFVSEFEESGLRSLGLERS